MNIQDASEVVDDFRLFFHSPPQLVEIIDGGIKFQGEELIPHIQGQNGSTIIMLFNYLITYLINHLNSATPVARSAA